MIVDLFRKNKKEKVIGGESNFVLDTFILLTSKTYPYKTEDDLVFDMIKIGVFPKELQQDSHGNYFYKIGESRTMFASHLDVSCRDQEAVTHVITKDGIIATDGKTVLGADDKAGVTVMLYMMKYNIPGLYYFFIGEEVGCVGSGLAAKYGDFKGKYDRVISFDRRGTSSIITYQSSSRCCSDAFADDLASELNNSGLGLKYKKDEGGVYTDSAEFTDIISECTNISVGYYSEHTTKETQDIEHLKKLADACLVVNWESLTTKRDPKTTEYKSWSWKSNSYASNTGYSSKGRDGWTQQTNWRNRDYYSSGYADENYDFDFNSKKKRKRNKKKSNNKNFFDAGDSKLIPLTKSGSVKVFEKEEKVSFHKSTQYDWLMEKVLDNKLSLVELEVLKDQYFDFEDPKDKEYYDFLRDYISENGQ
jgi:hypothetical protein